MSRDFTTVGVVGLGTMGAGIAEVFARAGCAVVGAEAGDEQLELGRGHLEKSTERAVSRGRLSPADQRAMLDRLTFTTDLADLADCDLVVEAVLEQLDLKASVFGRLDEVVSPSAVLATNTSSLNVTRIAAVTTRPARVIGMHFFNPAPVQRLVEVVSTVVTEPGLVDEVADLAGRLGKNPVVVSDRTGFIANALLFGYLNEAVDLYEQRRATREELDAAMREGAGFPLGPLALLDLIGIDTSYEILRAMYGERHRRRHAPAPLLGHLTTAGRLGRKSGQGFYTYSGPRSGTVVDDAETPSADAGSSGAAAAVRLRYGHVLGELAEVVAAATTEPTVVDALLLPYLNDAVRMLAEGYAGVDDIDTAMRDGCALPQGPFEMLDAIGPRIVLDKLHRRYEENRQPDWAPAPLLHLVAESGRGFRPHSDGA